MKGHKKGIIAIAIFSFVFGTAFIGSVIFLKQKKYGNSVGVVYIDGVITESENTIKYLRMAEDSNDVRAVVLRINSPGGLVAPTWEIYRAVRKLRNKKPVVASIETIGASGGYYIASAADKIIVTPGTATGSIGVIIRSMNIKKIYDRFGIKNVVIKSGKMKDSLASYRELTTAEKSYLQGMVNEMYEQFLMDVASGRGINIEEIKHYADGRIITGKKALELNLVDGFGNFYDAIDEAGKLAGIKGRPGIVRYVERPSFFKRLFFSLSSKKIEQVVSNLLEGGFLNTFFAYLCTDYNFVGGY